jgi:hypothetical protein
VSEASDNHRCQATNRRSEPCGRIATEGRFCVVHSGKLDLRAVGRLGGRGRTRSVLGISDEVADEKLRAQAAKRLEALVHSDNESIAVRAATALHSYRAVEAPREPRAHERVETRPRKVVGLRDVLAFAEEIGALNDLIPDEMILRAAERVRERRESGEPDPSVVGLDGDAA